MTVSIRYRAALRQTDGRATCKAFEFSSAKSAALFMWGKDTACYEFSVGGVWHRFHYPELSYLAKEILSYVRSYRRATERIYAALLPPPAPCLTWRDALPR